MDINFDRDERASVSPPRCGVVAAGKPSSARVGTAKSLFGPAILAYDLSFSFLWFSLRSGFCSGNCCSKSRVVSPGSGIDVGAGMGFGTGPIFGPAV